jgi:hypothetical protein
MPNTRLVVAFGKVSTPETLVWLEPHTLELQHLEPGTALVFVTQSHPGNFAHSSGLGAAGVWGWPHWNLAAKAVKFQGVLKFDASKKHHARYPVVRRELWSYGSPYAPQLKWLNGRPRGYKRFANHMRAW